MGGFRVKSPPPTADSTTQIIWAVMTIIRATFPHYWAVRIVMSIHEQYMTIFPAKKNLSKWATRWVLNTKQRLDFSRLQRVATRFGGGWAPTGYFMENLSDVLKKPNY